jgi:MraZ protein
MFRGSFEHCIDEKGRVSVPVRFRDILQGLGDNRVVITNFRIGGEPCLDVYPSISWRELEDKLRAKPQFDLKFLRFQNYYFASAQDCELDRQGRILLPPILRDYALLKKDVLFTSAIDKFRIWSPEVFKKSFAEVDQQLVEHPEEMGDLGI